MSTSSASKSGIPALVNPRLHDNKNKEFSKNPLKRALRDTNSNPLNIPSISSSDRLTSGGAPSITERKADTESEVDEKVRRTAPAVIDLNLRLYNNNQKIQLPDPFSTPRTFIRKTGNQVSRFNNSNLHSVISVEEEEKSIEELITDFGKTLEYETSEKGNQPPNIIWKNGKKDRTIDENWFIADPPPPTKKFLLVRNSLEARHQSNFDKGLQVLEHLLPVKKGRNKFGKDMEGDNKIEESERAIQEAGRLSDSDIFLSNRSREQYRSDFVKFALTTTIIKNSDEENPWDIRNIDIQDLVNITKTIISSKIESKHVVLCRINSLLCKISPQIRENQNWNKLYKSLYGQLARLIDQNSLTRGIEIDSFVELSRRLTTKSSPSAEGTVRINANHSAESDSLRYSKDGSRGPFGILPRLKMTKETVDKLTVKYTALNFTGESPEEIAKREEEKCLAKKKHTIIKRKTQKLIEVAAVIEKNSSRNSSKATQKESECEEKSAKNDKSTEMDKPDNTATATANTGLHFTEEDLEKLSEILKADDPDQEGNNSDDSDSSSSWNSSLSASSSWPSSPDNSHRNQTNKSSDGNEQMNKSSGGFSSSKKQESDDDIRLGMLIPKGWKGISLGEFAAAAQQAFWLGARGGEWPNMNIEKINHIGRQQEKFIRCSWSQSKTRLQGIEDSIQLDCCCSQFKVENPSNPNPLYAPICPVHCCNTQNWNRIKLLPVNQRSEMLIDLFQLCGMDNGPSNDSKIMSREHSLHLCRIGMAMSMSSSRCTTDEIMQLGRWRCPQSAILYQKQAKRVPDLLSIEWPIFRGTSMGETSLESVLHSFMDNRINWSLRRQLRIRGEEENQPSKRKKTIDIPFQRE